MIEAFQYINKAFESKVRLGIMAILMVSEAAEKFLPCLLGFVIGQDASSDR
ncbi:transcriptional regulator, partial [Bacteroides xylanisolvens]